MLNRPFILLYLLVGSFFSAGYAVADVMPENHFSGFATLGLVTSSNSDLAFRRDVTQEDGSYDGSTEWKTDSLVGLQWQGRWSANFDTTVQLVAKERHENTLEKSIEWAFVHYRVVDGLDVRVGRLGSDVFMLSEYRQVGYALQWVRPPQDFYGLLSLYHFDGLDVTKRFDFSNGTLHIKAYYGNSNEHYPGSDGTGKGVDLDFNSAGIGFNLELENWKWRYTYAEVGMNNNIVKPLTDALLTTSPFWPEVTNIVQEMDTKDKSIIYHELGATYDNNIWWAQAEAAVLSSDTLIGPNGRLFYLSIGRRFGAVSIYGLRGYSRPDEDAPVFTAPAGYPSPLGDLLGMLADAATVSVDSVNQEQDSVGIGARWDFRPKMAIKFQVDKFDIEKSGTNLWVRSGPMQFTENQTSTVISLSMDVLF